jgi:beta-glucosidase
MNGTDLRGKHNEATALVQQMSLEEKAGLCSGKGFWHLKAVERLGLKPVMVTDGPHGLRKQVRGGDHVGLNKSVPATCFPTAAAMACSWDVDLLHEVGVALGRECLAEHVTVLLGPGVNIKRHPLCGRNFEYYSEDPHLAGELAAAWINGVQSQGVGTSLKHYAVNNQETARMYVDAIVDERTLREIYLRAFEIAIQKASPWTVMSAYNRVNGFYCAESDFLQNRVLREEWGFRGLVVSDWGATNERVTGLRNGLDLEMPGNGGINDRLIVHAVKNGQLAESILDRAAVRITSVLLAGTDITTRSTPADLDAHHTLARRVAAESIVLLKNETALLPLAVDDDIAVIGSFAQMPRIQGTGSSQVNPVRVDDAWTALQAALGRPIPFARGYDQLAAGEDPDLIEAAVEVAASAKKILLFVGLPGIFESEGFDRTTMDMPAQHTRLIEAVCRVNPATIVILTNGAPVTMAWSKQPGAILATCLSGQAGGAAVVDVLLGRVNPSGRLPETLPWKQANVPSDPWFPGTGRSVEYRDGIYVGYRYYNSFGVDVCYPFGHGLSYTRFEYESADAPKNWIAADKPLHVTVTLTNGGDRAGSEVVQLYLSRPGSEVYRPTQELKGFSKVFLQPGEIAATRISLDRRAFAIWDRAQQRWVVEPGRWQILIGSSSRDIRLRLDLDVHSDDLLSAELRVAGPQHDPENQRLQSTDTTFAAMLGHPVPAPESVRPFHRNSTLDEIASTWLGARVRQKALDVFAQRMGGAGNDATLTKMMDEMARSMPLRAMALFAGGAFAPHHLDALLEALNGKYVKAIYALFTGK